MLSLYYILVLHPCITSLYYILVIHPCITSLYYILVLYPCITSLYYVVVLHPCITSLYYILVLQPSTSAYLTSFSCIKIEHNRYRVLCIDCVRFWCTKNGKIRWTVSDIMHGTYNIHIQCALFYVILLHFSAFPHALSYPAAFIALVRN